jgi:hypothetical protein
MDKPRLSAGLLSSPSAAGSGPAGFLLKAPIDIQALKTQTPEGRVKGSWNTAAQGARICRESPLMLTEGDTLSSKGMGRFSPIPGEPPGGEGGVWGNAPRFTGAVQAPKGADLAPFGGELIRLICVAM